MAGERFVVDGQGRVASARTTSASPVGEFGSILGGIVMGALAGAAKSRQGGTPSREIGGGFGAGAGAAVEAADQRDDRNRAQAQTQFANQQQVQRATREQLESAAQIQHLAAQTASELSATQRANDEHPLIMKSREMGLNHRRPHHHLASTTPIHSTTLPAIVNFPNLPPLLSAPAPSRYTHIDP